MKGKMMKHAQQKGAFTAAKGDKMVKQRLSKKNDHEEDTHIPAGIEQNELGFNETHLPDIEPRWAFPLVSKGLGQGEYEKKELTKVPS